jgi:hypothetical protein
MGDGRQAAREMTGGAEWRSGRPGPYVFTEATPAADETQIESTTGGDAT